MMKKRKMISMLLMLVLAICLIGCNQKQKEGENISAELSAKEMVVELMKWEFPKIDPEEYDVTEWAEEWLKELPEVAPYIGDCYVVGKPEGESRALMLGYFWFDEMPYGKEQGDKIEKCLMDKLREMAEGAYLSPFMNMGDGVMFGIATSGRGSDLSIYHSWVRQGKFADSVQEESK